MNNLRGIFSKVASSIPKGGAGGAGGAQVPNGAGAGAGVLVALGLGTYAAYHSVVTIQPGHRGIIYNRIGGLDDKHHLKEGLNFVVPWFQRPIVFDIRTRPQPIDTTSGSKGTCLAHGKTNIWLTYLYLFPICWFFFHRFADGVDISESSVQARCREPQFHLQKTGH
jgi:prohibitin 2